MLEMYNLNKLQNNRENNAKTLKIINTFHETMKHTYHIFTGTQTHIQAYTNVC